MKETLFAGAFAILTTIAILAAPATAFAASSSDQLRLCANTAVSEGVASEDGYRARFVKSKGGGVKTVTIKLIPHADGADTITAQCKIKRGEVVDFAVKA